MNLFNLVPATLSALKQGKELENPEAWKNAQAITSLLVSFVVMLKAVGVDLHLQDDTITAIIGYAGTALCALVNAYLSIATSKRVGIAINGTIPPIELVAHSEPGSVQQPDVSPVADSESKSDAIDAVGFGDK